MRIAVFGTGGAGGYFGARLAQSGEEVIFIARGEHLKALQTDGLQLESVKGDLRIKPVAATADPSAVGPVDVVLLGVKTWQVADAIPAMRPLLGPQTFVVPLQNGVETPALLAEALGRERVVGGLANIFSFIASPGLLRHIGGPARIVFGELDRRPSQRIVQLRAALERAPGVAVETPEDIHVAMWEKLIFVAPLGGLGAVTGAPIGIFRELGATRQMLVDSMHEIAEVGRARGIPLSADVVERILKLIDEQPPGATASLQRDIMAGRPSELEAWSGSVVRLGRESGVATPLHQYFYASLLPQEQRARGIREFPADSAFF